MENEKVTKAVNAKLYNMKSGLDGIIQLVSSGVVATDKVGDAIMSLAVKAVDELSQLFNDDSMP